MEERLKYEEAKKIVYGAIDEYIAYWNNDMSIKDEIKTKIIDVLNKAKECNNIYLIGSIAISEYDKINSNDSIMGKLNNEMKERSMGYFWSQLYKLRVLIKSLNVPTAEIVSNSFKDIITIGKTGEGWRNVVNKEDKFKDIPETAFNHITNDGEGNSFIFANSLAKLLHENGVKSEIVAATSNGKNRFGVMYNDKNEYSNNVKYIADPYAEIKVLTKMNINTKLEREKAYKDRAEEIEKLTPNVKDNSRLSVMDFLGENDFVWSVGNPYIGSNETVGDRFSNIEKRIIVKNCIDKSEEKKATKIANQDNYDR